LHKQLYLFYLCLMKAKTPVTREDLIYLLTGRTFMAFGRTLQRNFNAAGVDISQEQWTLLAELWKEEGITQHELGIRTYRDKPATTRLIDNLEKKGLVIRASHKTDRRVNLIYLTPEGRKLENIASKTINITIENAIDGLSEQDLIEFKKTMYKVFENLNK
jgi:DNA-binding MarR family transcriptional regulator